MIGAVRTTCIKEHQSNQLAAEMHVEIFVQDISIGYKSLNTRFKLLILRNAR